MAIYLVTGAAGFIASKVCEFLLADGHTVVGVDNLNDYYDVRLKHYRLGRIARQAGVPEADVIRYGLGVKGGGFSSQITSNQDPITLKSDRFEFHTLDIEDLPALERLFERSNFSAVFNLAARAGVRYSMENPHVYLSTNTLGTLNLLECQRKYGVKKQVLASTSSLYAGCPMPFTEDQPVNTPLSPYAASKKAAEAMAYSYHHLYGLDISVLRYFTVYGPAGRPDMAPYRFVHWIATGQPIKLFGDGNQTRDFTYVDDIARGTILAARLFGGQSLKIGDSRSDIGVAASVERADDSTPNPHRPSSISESETSGFQIINLGAGSQPITINAMIALIEQNIGKIAVIDKLPINPVDIPDTRADITQADSLIGWKPMTEFAEGIRRLTDWHRDNRELLNSIEI